MTCGDPLPACTTDDVIVGLAQISELVHNATTFFFFVSVVLVFAVAVGVVTLFVNGRTR